MIIGPESTGKSTLSEALAGALHTKWVPEYAREYLLQLNRPYTEPDLLKIAAGQITLEDKMLQHAATYLLCDTDLYVIKVWSEHSYGQCDRWILEQIAVRKYDLYLFTDIDIEWTDDPLREHPGPWRQYFYHVYHDIVQNSNVPWAIINGNPEERLQKALQAIESSCR